MIAPPTPATWECMFVLCADAIASMKQALAAAGLLAPPWFQAPEVKNLTDAQLGQALCDAAHRADSVQPIDF